MRFAQHSGLKTHRNTQCVFSVVDTALHADGVLRDAVRVRNRIGAITVAKPSVIRPPARDTRKKNISASLSDAVGVPRGNT